MDISMQVAELHYLSVPEWDPAAVVERVEALIESGVESPEPEEPSPTRLFFHTRYPMQFSDGTAPAVTSFIWTERPSDPNHCLEAIQQTWDLEDAQERIQACQGYHLVTEFMAQWLEPAYRMKLFHGVLQAIVELTKPHAIVFRHAQKVVAPERYLTYCSEAPILRPGSLNVRSFRVANVPEREMIMDTRGLEEVGLHDLQCHFQDLDPNDVSELLYNAGIYIGEMGPVIESGHTISGIEPGSKWVCRFEEALVAPEREVLDLNPGPPFAGGGR